MQHCIVDLLFSGFVSVFYFLSVDNLFDIDQSFIKVTANHSGLSERTGGKKTGQSIEQANKIERNILKYESLKNRLNRTHKKHFVCLHVSVRNREKPT